MPFRIPSPVSDSLPRRCLRACLTAGVVLLAASCSLLPPSMHKQEAGPEKAATEQAPFGPQSAGNAQVIQPAPEAPRAEAKVFKGTGVFLNTKPPAPPAPPGPEEASLNFESLDVREVAKVILGDYLKQSYTVHPAVQGTITFRTVRPIPMKDLLPTLEMLLRQNNATAVREDGVYKILP